jgi:hypothetical protein
MEGEENKEEEDPMMEKEESEQSVEDITKEMCCCCVCNCQDERTRPFSCCGCFPIKCGLITVGIIYLVITVALFVEVFYCLLNEYIHWWYVPVAVLCLIPNIIGVCFFIRFFTKDQESTRVKLIAALILGIVGITLLVIWNLCYF